MECVCVCVCVCVFCLSLQVSSVLNDVSPLCSLAYVYKHPCCVSPTASSLNIQTSSFSLFLCHSVLPPATAFASLCSVTAQRVSVEVTEGPVQSVFLLGELKQQRQRAVAHI